MKNWMIYGGILIVLAIVGVFVYKHHKKRKEDEPLPPPEEDASTEANFIGVATQAKKECGCTTANCHCFPLKLGSEGKKVKQLQAFLTKKMRTDKGKKIKFQNAGVFDPATKAVLQTLFGISEVNKGFFYQHRIESYKVK